MTPYKPHWIVLGPGAIGGLIASHLLSAGERVSVLPREAQTVDCHWQLESEGIIHNYSAPVLSTPILENSVFVVAVKAFDVIPALRRLIALDGFHKTIPIVLSHNGMVALPEPLSDLNLHPLVTTHGVIKAREPDGRFSLEHRGIGRSWLEVANQPQPPFAKALQQHFSPLSIEKSLTERRWLKLIVNCVINPLTSIEQCRNGALLAPGYECRIKGLVSEAVAIAHAQGIALSEAQCYQEVRHVAKETADNRSSMLQDVLQARPTEIHQLTGYLLAAGRANGVATPHHQQVMEAFRQLYSD